MNKFKNKNNHHFILPDTEFGVANSICIYNVAECEVKIIFPAGQSLTLC